MISRIHSPYSKRKLFLLQKLKRVKNLGPWKLMENFLILVPHCGK